MASLARWCYTHRWRVLAGWLLVLVAVAGAGTAAGTSFTTVPGGSAVDYTQINRDVQDVEITGTLVAGNNVVVTINGVAGSSIPFTSSHNGTVELIQQAIVTQMACLLYTSTLPTILLV